MRNYVTSALPCLAVTLLAVALGGCETTNSMNRDLKRDADRATIQLNRQRAELAAAQTLAEQSKTSADAETKRAEASNRESAELRQKLSRTEADLLVARQKVRELEEAALVARQGMPATRPAQP